MNYPRAILRCALQAILIFVLCVPVEASLETVDNPSLDYEYKIYENGGFFRYPSPFYLVGHNEAKASCDADTDPIDCQASGTLVEFEASEIPGEVRMLAFAAGPEGGTNPTNGLQVQAAAQLIPDSLDANHAVDVDQRVITFMTQDFQVTEPETFTLIMDLTGSSTFDAFDNGTSPPWLAEATTTFVVDLKERHMLEGAQQDLVQVSGFPITLTESEPQQSVVIDMIAETSGPQVYSVQYKLSVKIILETEIVNFNGPEEVSYGLLSGNYNLATVEDPLCPHCPLHGRGFGRRRY
jgi:hypothetical protein